MIYLKNLFILALLNCTLNTISSQSAKLSETEPSKFEKGSTTVVVIPDTQGYSTSNENIVVVEGLMKWIVANKESRNIMSVVHVGDMTNNNTKGQWARIRNCYSILDDHLPYIVCEGNHDVKKTKGNYVDLLNQYFKIEDNQCNATIFHSSFESDKLQNSSYKLLINEQKFLFISLEFSPRLAVIEWANQLIKANKDCRIFLTVHDYLSEHSRLISSDGQPKPVQKTEGGAKRRTYGIDIYEQLIRQNANLEFLVCGHAGAARLRKEGEPLSSIEERAVARAGKYAYVKEDYFKTFCYDRDIATGHRKDEFEGGLTKHQILFNAQWIKDEYGKGNGGDGWILLMEFNQNNESVKVKTFSPYLQKWRDGSEYNYELQRTQSNTL